MQQPNLQSAFSLGAMAAWWDGADYSSHVHSAVDREVGELSTSSSKDRIAKTIKDKIKKCVAAVFSKQSPPGTPHFDFLDMVQDFTCQVLDRLIREDAHKVWVKEIRWGRLLSTCLIVPPFLTAERILDTCTHCATRYLTEREWMTGQWCPPQAQQPQASASWFPPAQEPPANAAGRRRSWGDWGSKDSPPASDTPTTCPSSEHSSRPGEAEWGSTQRLPGAPSPFEMPSPPMSWNTGAAACYGHQEPPVLPPPEGSLQWFMWECIEGPDANPEEAFMLQQQFLAMWSEDKKSTDYGIQEVTDAHLAVIQYLKDAGGRLQMKARLRFQ